MSDGPKSPIDPTQVIVNGEPIDRSTIEPIAVPDQIVAPSAHRVRIPMSPHPNTDNMPVSSSFQNKPQPQPQPSPVVEPQPSELHFPSQTYRITHTPQSGDSIERDLEIPDYSAMNGLEQHRCRADFSNKFKAFRSAYPDLFQQGDYVAAFDINADLTYIHIEYQSFRDMVNIHAIAANYKQAMVLAWFSIEALFVWLGIDVAKGFTQHQIKSLNRYESYLVAMGEKAVLKGTGGIFSLEEFSPEATLIILTIVSSVAFVAIKVFAPKFGIDTNTASSMLVGMTDMLSSSGTPNPLTSQMPSSGGYLDMFANIVTANPDAAYNVGTVARDGMSALPRLANPNAQPQQPQVQQPQQQTQVAQQRYRPQYDE
jgi:hypothetical protein